MIILLLAHPKKWTIVLFNRLLNTFVALSIGSHNNWSLGLNNP